jgi:hypothetical protein
MEHAKNTYLSALNTVNNDVVWVSYDFPATRIPVTLPVQIRMLCDRQNSLVQSLPHTPCSLNVSFCNVLDDACQVSASIEFPNDGQHQIF